MSPRRSQERPKRPQDGPKSAPRAARSAPRGAQEQPGAHQKGPKRAKRLRDAPGAHFGLILEGPGHHFQQLRRPFRSSRALRQTIENTLRNHGSKGILSVWPAIGAEKATTTREFTLSPAKTSYFTNPTGLPGVFFTRRTSKTLGFYVVPCFPNLFGTTRGSPRP